MDPCIYVHPDNVEEARKELNLKAAVIARPDDYMIHNKCTQLIVETESGIHNRCFLASSPFGNFLIVYGRFGRVRTISSEIDFELTQDVFSFLGIDRIVGTFAVGSVRKEDPAGTVFIPHDLIGFGPFSNTRRRAVGFRNVDSFRPFCEPIRQSIVKAADEANIAVRSKGIYACFHGFPRIETLAELTAYDAMGCEIVGQTLDPEATLAREAGCHYAAIAVTIDDHAIRSRFLENDNTARQAIDSNIVTGRKATFDLFLKALPLIIEARTSCNCSHQGDVVRRKKNLFYYRPKTELDRTS